MIRGACTQFRRCIGSNFFVRSSSSVSERLKVISHTKRIKDDYEEGKPAKMDGANVFVNSLVTQGVEYMFGIVGIPVIEIAIAAQQVGIKYIGMRNEQSASYAASIVGYLTDRPAVCLVVSGPGVIHALAGMSNAKENCWPLIVAGGSSDTSQQEMGAFQEMPQVELARPYCKFSARPSTIADIPAYVEKAMRNCIQGRPGVSYIDLPGDLITGTVDESSVRWVGKSPPRYITNAPQDAITSAMKILSSAERPLIIIGKGAAYSRAEEEIQQFIERTGIPFLPTPMGKGVISDHHDNCVAAARSRALQKADVILLLGARLNWILHFGMPPRFNPAVQIIQVDVCPEEIGNNVLPSVSLCGDVASITKQLVHEYDHNFSQYHCQQSTEWWKELKGKITDNIEKTKSMIANSSFPMNFYKMYDEICSLLPNDCIIVNEGANTMDIGRTMILNKYPRCRLDAGSFGTMGVGSGFAIAAALVELRNSKENGMPLKKVVCVQGDSAFGFGAMELETACRYKLPIVFIIANNNGIYNGLDKMSWDEMLVDCDQESLPLSLPPVALNPHTRYEKIMTAFNCPGYEVKTVDELQDSLKKALNEIEKPSLIHVYIENTSARKTQEFDWLTKSNL